MPTFQEYNKKIKSLKNTLKITKTMKMVSTSKLRKAQNLQQNNLVEKCTFCIISLFCCKAQRKVENFMLRLGVIGSFINLIICVITEAGQDDAGCVCNSLHLASSKT